MWSAHVSHIIDILINYLVLHKVVSGGVSAWLHLKPVYYLNLEIDDLCLWKILDYLSCTFFACSLCVFILFLMIKYKSFNLLHLQAQYFGLSIIFQWTVSWIFWVQGDVNKY